jgi:hypothetical protein
VFTTTPSDLLLPFRSPRNIAAVAVGAAAAAGIAWYLLTRTRLTPEEIERNRRDLLATTGRITDGSITDLSSPSEDPSPTPNVIVYTYRIGGVAYECAQVVTGLADHVRDIRIDLPIQVRYDPHNPANSIVVADSWSGLRLSSPFPHAHDLNAATSHLPTQNAPPD